MLGNIQLLFSTLVLLLPAEAMEQALEATDVVKTRSEQEKYQMKTREVARECT